MQNQGHLQAAGLVQNQSRTRACENGTAPMGHNIRHSALWPIAQRWTRNNKSIAHAARH
jgi:hypothetical protein